MKTFDGRSLNTQEELLAFLRAHAPEIFSEGKVDPIKLKQTLGEQAAVEGERYGLSWVGKSGCFSAIQEQTTATLKPDRNGSVDFDRTKNLFIEGDNLETLKVLQRSYYNRVKMIYIDPPYNTGGDFIYNDDFRRSRREEMLATGEIDDDGDLTRADGLAANRRDSNGHFHSDWLNMMYPRLFLAKNLLRDDGVIFVSIDDNEVHNLRLVMNEIFGEENFIGEFIWRKKEGGGQADDYFVTEHEFILVYAKSDAFTWIDEMIPVDESKFDKEDESGKFTAVKLAKWGNTAKREDRPSMYFPLKAPDGKNVYPIAPDGSEGRWRVGKERMQGFIDNNLILWREKEGKFFPYEKIYYSSESIKTLKDRSIIFDLAYTGSGTNVLTNIFRKKDVFLNPKPVELIAFLMQNNTSGDDIILDFFAGSGTTAHAVMAQNAQDGGNRRFICVQLPEACDEESEAYKAGYGTIADIARERIRRAGSAVAASNSEKPVDIGFKSFKLDASNFKVWQGKFTDTESLLAAMEDFVDNILPESTEENMLFELILKSGLDLHVPVEERVLDGEKCYVLDGGKLFMYLGRNITEPMADEIIRFRPEKFVCLDRCFRSNDQLKTNIALHMEEEGIDLRVV